MSNGIFDMQDAGFRMGVNVKLTKRDKKTGRVIETREGHNTCLKLQLLGIVKFLNGEYNETMPWLEYYSWIPRYLGVGTNNASYASSEGVGTEVSINDSRLLCEISPRIALPDRNTIVNKSTQRYVQLVITTYLPSEYYNGETIAEAGLFSKSSGNNCLFRIVFDGITKTEDSVIEVDWTISVISVESDNAAYVELDTTDLQEMISECLDAIESIDEDALGTIITDLKSAITLMLTQNITQTQIDNMTTTLGTDLSNLDTSSIGGDGVLTQEEYETAVATTEEILNGSTTDDTETE